MDFRCCFSSCCHYYYYLLPMYNHFIQNCHITWSMAKARAQECDRVLWSVSKTKPTYTLFRPVNILRAITVNQLKIFTIQSDIYDTKSVSKQNEWKCAVMTLMSTNKNIKLNSEQQKKDKIKIESTTLFCDSCKHSSMQSTAHKFLQ